MSLKVKIKQAVKRIIWDVSCLFPVDKRKIAVSSYYGRGYGDNPKAIADELLRRGADVRIYWLVKDKIEAESLPKGIIPVKFGSPSGFFHLATARVWIDNCRKTFVRKRKGQTYIQLWHGFALKRIEGDAPDSLEEIYIENAKKDSAATDLIVSDSAFMTSVYRSAFWYSGEVAEWGQPRNDALICGDGEAYSEVRHFFGLGENEKILLYAPTFRCDYSLEPYKIDAERVIAAAERRFGGKFRFLFRLHPNLSAKSEELDYSSEAVNASYYPDMQRLLAASDIVVTDYSSLMFDFALTGKPAFRFATDIEAYRADRNFYFDLDSLPFPQAVDNSSLEAAILSFDSEKYAAAVSEFWGKVGMKLSGDAASKCADLILSLGAEK